jgi:hypothetical protein
VLLGNSDIDDPLGQTAQRWANPNIENLLKRLKEIHKLL